MARRKTKRLGNWLLLLASLLLTLGLAETVLRLAGFRPGYIPSYSAFKPVDKLVVYDRFLTDGEGVYKANPLSKWDPDIQVNSDGFRGIPFEPADATRPKILFLGDSFTWGLSARPITNSFVDLVSRHGYLAYNAGIPGTGPNQYAYLAEKYIPILRPDFVAVMFYLGNDMKRPDPMIPYHNAHHLTNAGSLNPFDEAGRYMSAEKAYQYYLRLSNKVAIDPGDRSAGASLGRILTRTVVGSYFWWGAGKIAGRSPGSGEKKLRPSDAPEIPAAPEDCRAEYLRPYLKRIREASEAGRARMILFLIPKRPSKAAGIHNYENNRCLFDDFDPVVPPANLLGEEDYMKPPNDHLNNAGHEKYARLILNTLAAQIAK
jgi:hypothetical protein